MIARLVSATIVAGSIAYCKYQEHAMNRQISKLEAKLENDMTRIREDVNNLGKN
jgi:cell division protein FtsL